MNWLEEIAFRKEGNANSPLGEWHWKLPQPAELLIMEREKPADTIFLTPGRRFDLEYLEGQGFTPKDLSEMEPQEIHDTAEVLTEVDPGLLGC